MKLLPAQREIIEYGGGGVMVSASAGSGKTFVMIERIKRLILQKKAEVKDILAITYVKTAAAEMKEKLARAIADEIANGGDAEYLGRQLKDLPSASVSTVHSFCAELLRTWFFAAGLDPSFAILDENESAVLKKRAVNEVFDRYYAEDDADFKNLVALFAVKRGDDALKKYVISLYDFVNSEEKPFELLEKGAEYYSEEGLCRAAAQLLSDMKEELALFAERERELLCSLKACPALKKAADYGESLASAAEKLAEIGEPFAFCAEAARVELPRFPSLRLKEGELELKNAQLELKKEFSAWLEEAAETLSDFGQESIKSRASRKVYDKLTEVTVKFAGEYSRLKEEKTGVDFSDLEHKAAKLLENEEVAACVRDRYKYVFADEYQDVNGVQEKILSAVSDDILFMVGDVKQCIYAFRGCNPDIFADKFGRYCAGAGAAFRLDCNFRCSDAVIDAVNKTFSAVMTRENSRVDYAREALLQSGGLYGGYAGEAVLHVIEREKKPKEREEPRIYSVAEEARKCEVPSSYTEGRFIAELVQNTVGKMFFDIKENRARAVGYGDIVVLSRSMRGFADVVLSELKKSGIPASVETRAGVTEFPEVKLLVEFLKVIDNPDSDIPLAAVMLSPVGGFSEEELLEIRRRGDRDGSLYFNCRQAIDGAGAAADKLREFFGYISLVRSIEPAVKAAGVLRRVIRDKNLDAYFMSRRLGAQRLKRVERLIAESETGGTKPSVAEFLKRIEDAGDSMTAAEAVSGDSVRIMSVHSSKGLEFPVVILAGMSRKFNFGDMKEEILKDRIYGLGLKYYDTVNMKKSDTAVRKLIKRRLKRSAVREEMRILYVAMTRARYSLHVVCDGVRPGGFKGKAERFADFLNAEHFECLVHGEGEPLGFLSKPRTILMSEQDDALTERMLKNLDFEYPYKISASMPVKRSVTQLSEKPPAFYERTEAETDAERGTNFHKFMQYVDFDRISQKELKEQIIGMKKRGIIESDDGIAVEAAEEILSGELFAEIKKGKIYREKQFLLRLSSADIYEGGVAEDSIVVQGIIDLFSVTDKGAILVDYKLTSLKNDGDVREVYKTQLEIYKTAVEKFYGIKVVKMAIINLTNSKIIYF